MQESLVITKGPPSYEVLQYTGSVEEQYFHLYSRTFRKTLLWMLNGDITSADRFRWFQSRHNVIIPAGRRRCSSLLFCTRHANSSFKPLLMREFFSRTVCCWRNKRGKGTFLSNFNLIILAFSLHNLKL